MIAIKPILSLEAAKGWDAHAPNVEEATQNEDNDMNLSSTSLLS